MNKLNNARELINRVSRDTRKPWPYPTRMLGKGANGVTFLTANDPPKVLKIALGNATREINALRKLQKSGSNFTPKLSNNYVTIRRRRNINILNRLFPNRNNNNVSLYVMNKVGNTSLYKYVKSGHGSSNNKRKIKDNILKAIKFMHSHGISHGDLHSGNILVELDDKGKMKKLWVIDFGRTVTIPAGRTENNVYKSLPFNRMYKNYNLFNASSMPFVELRHGPTGPARRNLNMFKIMYEGNKKNKCSPLGCLRPKAN